MSAFTTGIFKTWFGLGNSAAAAQLSGLLLMFVAILIYAEYWSRKQQRFHHTSSRYSALVQTRLQGWQALLASLVCLVPVLLGFIIPVAFLSYWALITYPDVIDADFFRLLQHSILLALSAAFIVSSLALFMAYGKRRDPNP
ncbi:MAG: iron ABC transporter permease, partial [Gammaproteobacteria bacterium]|nr:iron ABC transporter permease [Gammaproteobacteria bacterium]NIR92635.1 iron ABC transporter permease [Gammaproteobacteria bacterium]NIW43450.1 iron ABC transporter permease [Gammaproteobacteria bacterium]